MRMAAMMLATAMPYVSWQCTARRAAGTPAARVAPSMRSMEAGVPTPMVSAMDTCRGGGIGVEIISG